MLLQNNARALRGVCQSCESEVYKILPKIKDAPKASLTEEEKRRYPDAFCVRCQAHTPTTNARTVILDKKWGSPGVTKDGVTVSKEVELEDPFENMGAKLVNEVASKTSDVAGDGTTTATVLAEAIFSEGVKMLSAKVDPRDAARHRHPQRDRTSRLLRDLPRGTVYPARPTLVGEIAAPRPDHRRQKRLLNRYSGACPPDSPRNPVSRRRSSAGCTPNAAV